MSIFTIKQVRNTNVSFLYDKLILGKNLNVSEKEALLMIAVIFLNVGDEFTKELGYRIILLYCNLFEDYIPLYDVSFNRGYTPILKVIENHPKIRSQVDESFFNLYISSSIELYKENGNYLTYQQQDLKEFIRNTNDQSVAVIAPTSYGKSELIIEFCNKNPSTNICVLVPTKALLAQTRRRLLNGLSTNNGRKIITHPEMYNLGDKNLIAVLTQERLLRLIRKDLNLNFDTVFIDEAHNALNGDQRNLLLTKTIALLEKRNLKTAFKFLTPFLVDSENLLPRYTNFELEEFKINENIKTDRYYSINFRTDGQLKTYDQFINKFLPVPEESFVDDIDLILSKGSSKNIVYLNSPPKIEYFANRLLSNMEIIDDDNLSKAAKDISEFLHHDYSLVDCIRRGFVYHHGSVPDIVRLYIEHLYSENENISIIITSSTLLEGVNIPAETLFLLQYMKGRRKLSPSQFKNLSGRVCRFNEIFSKDKGSLTMLEPFIYIVGSNYVNSNANIEKFLVDSIKIDKSIRDDLENVLLKNKEITDEEEFDLQKADEMLENIEKGITGKDTDIAETDVGKISFMNNITEISIIEHEHEIAKSLEKIGEYELKTSEELIQCIRESFIRYIDEDLSDYRNLIRLKHKSAQQFYCMFLEWRMRSASYNEMIRSFLDYWDQEDSQKLVYVGKWGDTTKNGYRPLWVDINTKTNKERVNLSIVRIKEEQDFVDNIIIKYIEVLYELNLVDESLYLKIKYGTDDKRRIVMIKNGISNTLSSLLMKKYTKFITIDIESNTVVIDQKIIPRMRENGENQVLIFEVSFNTIYSSK